MAYAFYMFHTMNKNKGYVNSWAYTRIREEVAKLKSIYLKGENNGMWGKHHTEEARKKQGEASKNRPKESWERIRISKRGKKMSETFCEKCRERMIGNALNKGKKFIWSEERKKAHQELTAKLWKNDDYRKLMIEKQKNNPRSKGKHWKLSDETKSKHSKAAIGKHWWNNGTIATMSKECPGEGWTLGMLKY